MEKYITVSMLLKLDIDAIKEKWISSLAGTRMNYKNSCNIKNQ